MCESVSILSISVQTSSGYRIAFMSVCNELQVFLWRDDTPLILSCEEAGSLVVEHAHFFRLHLCNSCSGLTCFNINRCLGLRHHLVIGKQIRELQGPGCIRHSAVFLLPFHSTSVRVPVNDDVIHTQKTLLQNPTGQDTHLQRTRQLAM